MAWILEANWKAVEVEIVKDGREFVIVRSKGSTGGFRIRKNRVFATNSRTSNVDARTELLVASAFDRIISNRTSIVIAHRLFTIKNSDFIIVMDEGKIVEVGTHDELLLKEGHYLTSIMHNIRKINYGYLQSD